MTTLTIRPELHTALAAAAGKLAKQAELSIGLHNDCMYRKDTGDGHVACMVGLLITDDAYGSVIEGSSVEDGEVRKALDESLGFDITEDEKDLLGILQHWHDYIAGKVDGDKSKFNDMFLRRLRRVSMGCRFLYTGPVTDIDYSYIATYPLMSLFRDMADAYESALQA